MNKKTDTEKLYSFVYLFIEQKQKNNKSQLSNLIWWNKEFKIKKVIWIREICLTCLWKIKFTNI